MQPHCTLHWGTRRKCGRMLCDAPHLPQDIDERKLTLIQMSEHELDMDCVAVAMAERMIKKAFEVRHLFNPWSPCLPSYLPLSVSVCRC